MSYKDLVIIDNEKVSKKNNIFYCDNFEARISEDFKSNFNVTFIALSVIQTSIANPTISPFYFCILLFYLFFEVFFSFFRKLIKEKKSPIYPDEKHLHMLLYKSICKCLLSGCIGDIFSLTSFLKKEKNTSKNK